MFSLVFPISTYFFYNLQLFTHCFRSSSYNITVLQTEKKSERKRMIERTSTEMKMKQRINNCDSDICAFIWLLLLLLLLLLLMCSAVLLDDFWSEVCDVGSITNDLFCSFSLFFDDFFFSVFPSVLVYCIRELKYTIYMLFFFVCFCTYTRIVLFNAATISIMPVEYAFKK